MEDKEKDDNKSLSKRIALLTSMLGNRLIGEGDALAITKISSALIMLNQAQMLTSQDEKMALRLMNTAKKIATR